MLGLLEWRVAGVAHLLLARCCHLLLLSVLHIFYSSPAPHILLLILPHTFYSSPTSASLFSGWGRRCGPRRKGGNVTYSYTHLSSLLVLYITKDFYTSKAMKYGSRR